MIQCVSDKEHSRGMNLDSRKETLYIVMPAYNEAENIQAVVEAWYPIVENVGNESRLVIADSGSTDGTGVLLNQLKITYPRLEVLPDTLKQHGPKLIALYKYAIAAGADYIFQTDSDGQTNPEEFKTFWKMREEYEAIIGTRRVRGDGYIRKFVESVLCGILFVFFGVRVPDANAPFRLMKKKILQKYIYSFEQDYNLPNVMLTTYFSYHHENIQFVDISFRPRQAGKNSINLIKITKIGINALRDFAYFRTKMKEEGIQ